MEEKFNHIEEHSLIVRCQDRETMLGIYNYLERMIGNGDLFTVNLLADYDIYFGKEA